MVSEQKGIPVFGSMVGCDFYVLLCIIMYYYVLPYITTRYQVCITINM